MPVRRRLQPISNGEPDPYSEWTWVDGSGCSYGLTGEPVYRTEAAARRAWNAVGHVVMWESEAIGHVPAAATHYDGVTNHGRKAARKLWEADLPYRSSVVITAINEDRASVADFRRTHPTAAKSIDRYLDRYLASLDELEQDARALEGTEYFSRLHLNPYRYPARYGDAPDDIRDR